MGKIEYEFGNIRPFMARRLTVRVTNIEYPFQNTPVGHFPGHDLVVDELNLDVPEIDKDKYYKALEDINRSFDLITDPKTGKTFEVAMANLDAPEGDLDGEFSTYTSSISGNPGNAVEFAENSAVHPEKRRLYIASFGNGGSSYWESSERKYIRDTSRFTQPDGSALPTVAALSRALQSAGLNINRVSTNSVGGSYATALMAELPEGQVSRAYFKSRPNISNHNSSFRWAGGVLLGDIVDDRRYTKASHDPWKLTGEVVEEAEGRLRAAYSKEAENKHRGLAHKAQSSHALSKLWTDMISLSRGGVAFNDPAARDTVHALQKQPEALLTYHFPLQDRLYESEGDIRVFLNAAYDIGRTASFSLFTGQIEALLMPGRHRDHTHYPSLRWAFEQYAFNRHVDLDSI